MKTIAVYDGLTRKRLCYLKNAYDVSYVKTTSSLWTAAFTLPYDDPKNRHCESMNFADIWDTAADGSNKYIGLFRIMPSEHVKRASDSAITYSLEHVLATLIDDVMLGWHEIGNLGVYTNQVISYILSRQTVKRWSLGLCDYTHQYLYGWQDENLLNALYSITNAFVEDDFRWEFDTRSYPWTLSLRKVTEKAVTDIRYRKNINGIVKSVDPTNITTRLYCYGYGEADNKLNIKNVNKGLPYLDSPNISKYGVITRIWTDERFEVEEQLLQSGKAMLAALDEPIVSYDVDVATVRKAADLEAGDMVRVVDEGLDFYTRVVEVSKDDVSGAPLVGKVVLANKTTDIAQSTADMADRQRIATTYSQGSESLFADSLYDNADASNPAEIEFTIPSNAVHVNEILLNVDLTNFRAYSKATKGGGASTETSSSGGGSTQTSTYGGGTTETTTYDGGTQETSAQGGQGGWTTDSEGGGHETSEDHDDELYNLDPSSTTDSSYTHNHGIREGVQLISDVWIFGSPEAGYDVGYNAEYWVPSGAHTHGSHNHDFYLPSHRHDFSLPSHRHDFDVPDHRHEVDIPDHDHRVSIPSHTHDTRIPDHTHDILYGIYKGSSASSMTISIDDKVIGTYNRSVRDLNLISYMSKNANGEVLRGRHTISIKPNTLTRVECSVQIRLFTNSRGSGQY